MKKDKKAMKHKLWAANLTRDTYYCEDCGISVTKQELFNHMNEEELYTDALDRIAREIKGSNCE